MCGWRRRERKEGRDSRASLTTLQVPVRVEDICTSSTYSHNTHSHTHIPVRDERWLHRAGHERDSPTQ